MIVIYAVTQVHMLDQSPQQLSKAAAKSELKDVAAMMEGDAENLPMNWTGKFDRYVSAGSIEYWPHPQVIPGIVVLPLAHLG